MVCAVAVRRARPGIIIMKIPGRASHFAAGKTGKPSGADFREALAVEGGGGPSLSGGGVATPDSFNFASSW